MVCYNNDSGAPDGEMLLLLLSSSQGETKEDNLRNKVSIFDIIGCKKKTQLDDYYIYPSQPCPSISNTSIHAR